MPKRTSSRNLDVVQNAKRVFDQAIERSESLAVSDSMISIVMAEMGRRGGLVGGKRRLVTMTPERRTEIARLAAGKRWGKRTKKAVS